MRPSSRLDQIPPYLFAAIERQIAEKRAAGIDVISLGIGDPDLPTPRTSSRRRRAPPTRRRTSTRATRASRLPRGGGRVLRGASASRSTRPPDRPAARRQGGHRPRRPGPAGPGRRGPGRRPRLSGVHRRPLLADGAAALIPLVPELGFPRPGGDPGGHLRRAKMIFVSYPNNPTGAVIEDDFFARLVAFARANDIVVVHDNAYADITYDGYVAPSFLATPGRHGGRRRDVQPLQELQHDRLALPAPSSATARSSTPTGASRPTWTPACSARCSAPRGGAQRLAGVRASRCAAIYQRRRDLLVRRAADGRHARRAAQGHHLPVGARARRLHLRELHRAGAGAGGRRRHAGGAYGPSGEGYVRLSLTVPDDRLEEAVRRIEERVRL